MRYSMHPAVPVLVLILFSGGLNIAEAAALPETPIPVTKASYSSNPPLHPETATPLNAPPKKQTVSKPTSPAASKPSAGKATPAKPKFSNLHQISVEMAKPKTASTPKQAKSTKPAVAPDTAPVAGIEEESLPLPAEMPAPNTAGQKSANKAKPTALSEEDKLPILPGDEKTPASQTSSYLMWRMVFSLLAVLGLFFACVKWVLPQLVKRYPALFSRGEQEDSGIHALQRSPYKRLDRLPPQFKVITSTSLGTDKELHLVEIQGRQLVVATTPYAVTLIKELTEPVTSAADLNALLNGFQEAPKPGNGWMQIEEDYSPQTSRYESYRSPRIPPRTSLGLKREVHSEVPPNRKIKPKPLAAKVPLPEEREYQTGYQPQTQYEQPSEPYRLPRREHPYSHMQQQQPEQPLHMKYLQSDSGEHEPMKTGGLHALYKEPEDVVLLDDYDDSYPYSP